MYRDTSGLIWISTLEGLATFNPAFSGVMTFMGGPDRKIGLPGDKRHVGPGDANRRALDRPSGIRICDYRYCGAAHGRDCRTVVFSLWLERPQVAFCSVQTVAYFLPTTQGMMLSD